MKNTGWLLLIMLLLVLTACGTEVSGEHQGTITLMQSELPVKAWQMDNSHMTKLQGQVLLDQQPVARASVAISTVKTVETDRSGRFDAVIDQSQPLKIPVHIQSLDKATVQGKDLDQPMKDAMKKAQAELQIAYPITIKRVAASPGHPDQVEVHAQAQLETKTFFPAPMFDRYGWYGIIKDSDGHPVKGAVVELWEEEGMEPLTSSEPSGANGGYLIEAIPKNVDAVSLRVQINQLTYVLQQDVLLTIPSQTSLGLDITLPKHGLELASSMLRTRLLHGAVYQGIMIGVSSGQSVTYTSTVPTKDGSFLLTMPKQVWEKHPLLYETKIRLFQASPLQAGDVIPSERIPPARNYEPDHIQAQLKSSSS
ncbi:hypothetical protein ACTHPF_08995 [Paenibacillus sp. SAF-054]|uniref:hypothetical protein n=1 Tax=unclassified Paenibacillus TaxID=185978 RepID=UPI003F8012B6